jgi:pyrroline-5-carboxylate reductase
MHVNILVIGCGKMGGAMLKQWSTRHLGQIVVVDPHTDSVPPGVTLIRDIESVRARAFDVIVGAVKPQILEKILQDYREVIQRSECFFSIAAGFSTERAISILGDFPVVRAMPNLPALIGKGVTGLFANKFCSDLHRTNAEKLANAVGQSLWLHDEDQIDRITAIAGSGPGYIFEFIRLYIDAACALGFDEKTARNLVLQTIMGTTQMAIDSNETLTDLRNSVTSKNGTTEAGLNQLMSEDTLKNLLEQTTQAAYNRAIELR